MVRGWPGSTQRPLWWVLAGLLVVLVGVAVARLAVGSAESASAPGAAPSSSAPTLPHVRAAHGGRPVALVIGDSYSTGYGADDEQTDGYVAALSRRYGWKTTVIQMSGRGYIARSTDGAPPFPDTIAVTDIASIAPDVVVVQGGHNDPSVPSAQMQSAVITTIREVRSAAPSAPIIVVGALWPTADVPAYVVSNRSAIATAARSQANVLYVDTAGLTYPTIGDGVHPTSTGYAVISRRMESAIEAAKVASPR